MWVAYTAGTTRLTNHPAMGCGHGTPLLGGVRMHSEEPSSVAGRQSASGAPHTGPVARAVGLCRLVGLGSQRHVGRPICGKIRMVAPWDPFRGYPEGWLSHHTNEGTRVPRSSVLGPGRTCPGIWIWIWIWTWQAPESRPGTALVEFGKEKENGTEDGCGWAN